MANRFISKLRGFAELTDQELKALEQATRAPQAYRSRKDLIREGDQPGPVFVVLEGWAFRYKVLPNGSRQVIAFLMPGDACDLHIGMLAEMDHSIQTATPAQVATISRQTMDELMGTYPGIARAMYIAQLIDEGTLHHAMPVERSSKIYPTHPAAMIDGDQALARVRNKAADRS